MPVKKILAKFDCEPLSCKTQTVILKEVFTFQPLRSLILHIYRIHRFLCTNCEGSLWKTYAVLSLPCKFGKHYSCKKSTSMILIYNYSQQSQFCKTSNFIGHVGNFISFHIPEDEKQNSDLAEN